MTGQNPQTAPETVVTEGDEHVADVVELTPTVTQVAEVDDDFEGSDCSTDGNGVEFQPVVLPEEDLSGSICTQDGVEALSNEPEVAEVQGDALSQLMTGIATDLENRKAAEERRVQAVEERRAQRERERLERFDQMNDELTEVNQKLLRGIKFMKDTTGKNGKRTLVAFKDQVGLEKGKPFIDLLKENLENGRRLNRNLRRDAGPGEVKKYAALAEFALTVIFALKGIGVELKEDAPKNNRKASADRPQRPEAPIAPIATVGDLNGAEEPVAPAEQINAEAMKWQEGLDKELAQLESLLAECTQKQAQKLSPQKKLAKVNQVINLATAIAEKSDGRFTVETFNLSSKDKATNATEVRITVVKGLSAPESKQDGSSKLHKKVTTLTKRLGVYKNGTSEGPVEVNVKPDAEVGEKKTVEKPKPQVEGKSTADKAAEVAARQAEAQALSAWRKPFEEMITLFKAGVVGKEQMSGEERTAARGELLALLEAAEETGKVVVKALESKKEGSEEAPKAHSLADFQDGKVEALWKLKVVRVENPVEGDGSGKFAKDLTVLCHFNRRLLK